MNDPTRQLKEAIKDLEAMSGKRHWRDLEVRQNVATLEAQQINLSKSEAAAIRRWLCKRRRKTIAAMGREINDE